jgi:hypothetical protein
VSGCFTSLKPGTSPGSEYGSLNSLKYILILSLHSVFQVTVLQEVSLQCMKESYRQIQGLLSGTVLSPSSK